MYSSIPNHPYHFQADLIWCDGTCNLCFLGWMYPKRWIPSPGRVRRHACPGRRPGRPPPPPPQGTPRQWCSAPALITTHKHTSGSRIKITLLSGSVADPDTSDPYVFGPPVSESGFISQRYGSGSFFHQAKIVRKTLIPAILLILFDFLSLKNYLNVPPKVISRKTF